MFKLVACSYFLAFHFFHFQSQNQLLPFSHVIGSYRMSKVFEFH